MTTTGQVRALWARLAEAADLVALGPFGYAASWSPEARAYVALAELPAAALAPLAADLRRVAAAGKPAARVYAALLLRRLDPAGADALLHAMRGSAAPCQYAPGGCCVLGETLDEVASALLEVEPSPEVVVPRQLAHAVQSFRNCPVWVEPDAAAPRNRWARDFARLLDHELLGTAAAAIADLTAAPLPGRLYGAALLGRLDRERALALWGELARSAAKVRALDPRSPEAPEVRVAVATVAAAWRRRLGEP